MAKTKLAKNFASLTADDNGDITFVAARSTKNLNGLTYDVSTLQAQNADGDYNTLTAVEQEVAIPLMTDHSSSVRNKVGAIDKAHIEQVDGVDQVVMHAVFFDTEEAQEVRSRVLAGQLTDVSITTDYGTDEDAWETGNLVEAKIVEVSIVYAGAEPKAKILAKNAIETEAVEAEEVAEAEAVEVDAETDTEEQTTEIVQETEQETINNETEADEAEEVEEEEKETEVAKQETAEAVATNVADKGMVLNALVDLAKNNKLKGLTRSEVKEAVQNAVTLTGADGNDYVVPDAVFTEILAARRDTDILGTFNTKPVKRLTLMAEKRSEADLARAGKWTKGEQKQIQVNELQAQKFGIDYIYKLQTIDYADLNEDFGGLLLSYIHSELPQKVDEEEERAFVVGDGRSAGARKITSVVSLKAAAADNTNTHVYKYNGTSDTGTIEAVMNGIAKLGEDGPLYAVMNKATLTAFRQKGLSSSNGLPFSVETIADAIGVERIFARDYVANNVVYVYNGRYVERLTGGSNGETIEQYDIDYNNRKIEFIRPTGGGATGVYSAVEITTPGGVSV